MKAKDDVPVPTLVELRKLYRKMGSASAVARHVGITINRMNRLLRMAGILDLAHGYRAPKSVSHRGEGHHNWKGGTYVHQQGHIMEYAPDHPSARTAKGYVLQHRLVMERMLGRPLLRSEIVHHLNHVKTDNRPENLVVMTRSEHIRHHKEEAPRLSSGRFTSKAP